MKMKNLFAGLVATSMVVSMGTSAMAATYNDKNGTVAIGADLTAYAGEQVTVLIVEADKDGLTPTEIGNEMILYIDQTEAAAGIFQDMGVKGGALEAGKTYIVRIGGETLSEKGIIEEKFTVTSAPAVQYGNVITTGDSATVVDLDDALAVAEAVVKLRTLTDAQTAAANVIQKGDSATVVDLDDALAVAEAVVKLRDVNSFPVK